jgi:tetratricopeptide (TPR) repeat protein
MLSLTGDAVGGLDHHLRALAMFETHFGRDGARVLGELDNAAKDLMALGRLDEAQALIQRRCEGSERLRDANPQSWVACLDHRAGLASAREQYGDAARLYADAIVVAERVSGARHGDLASLRFSRGVALVRAGEAAAGRASIAEARALWSELRDEGHPETRDQLEWLGRADLALGETARAVQSFEHALALAERYGATATEISARRRDLAEARDADERR